MKRISIFLCAALMISLSISGALAQQDKKAQKMMQDLAVEKYVNSLIESQKFVFIPNRANTSLTEQPFIELSPNHSFKIIGDSIYSELPFMGSSSNSTIGSNDSPLDFTSNKFSYQVKKIEKKNNNATLITMQVQPNGKVEVLDVTLRVSASGSATLKIYGSRLSQMTYMGNIRALEK